MGSAKKIRRKVRYAFVYRFVQFLIFISNKMPRVAWLKFCGFLGRIGYRFAAQTRKLTFTHLQLAFGKEKSEKEIHTLAKDTFEYLGKNAGEILRASTNTFFALFQSAFMLLIHFRRRVFQRYLPVRIYLTARQVNKLAYFLIICFSIQDFLFRQ